jgi:uncharacterized membrane protein YccC
VAIAGALAVEYGFARATHAGAQDQLIAMLLGAVVAMTGSMALVGTGTWPKVRTAVFFPVALGIGMAAGVAVGDRTDLMLGVFVLVMFAAVLVRRFGPAYFFYGFMTWMGYFFASFLHATPAMLPSMLLKVTIASAWVLLLSITVLRTNARRTLARTSRAFRARADGVARISGELLEAAVTDQARVPRLRRRLAAHRARLAEAALILEGWSAEDGALPAGWSAVALRRRLLDVQFAVDGLASAADELAEGGDTGSIIGAARIVGLLARRDYAAAQRAAEGLLGHAGAGATGRGSGWWSARHLAAAAARFAALAREAGNPPEADPAEQFEPAITLFMGNLPGSPAFAGEVAARGHHWNPLARLDFISRQAVQAAVAGGLAILIGREISSTRYYWAVIAAFVAFSGTATRSETSIKAVNRVVGTLVGLFAGLGLAHLTAGHTTWILAVVVLSMASGQYLMRISYRYMIFFITIMVAQLYSVLHELSGDLLVTRLEETAAGAGIGIVVALVLAPLSTRDVVTTVRRNLLTALADLLRATAARFDGDPGRPAEAARDLDGLARAVDVRMYQLLLAAAPLTRPLVPGNSPSAIRHRLTLYSACAHHARGLAAAARHPTRPLGDAGRALAGAATALADAAATMADAGAPDGGGWSGALGHLAEADAALFVRPELSDPATAPPAGQALTHLRQLLLELAVHDGSTGPAADATPGHPADATPGHPADAAGVAARRSAPRWMPRPTSPLGGRPARHRAHRHPTGSASVGPRRR